MQSQRLQARLLIFLPGQQLREEMISQGATIGRAQGNLLQLQMPGVADHHLMVAARGDEYWLLDLGSAEGTRINGQSIREDHLLCDGDLILLGGLTQTEFRLFQDLPQPEDNTQQIGVQPTGKATKADSTKVEARPAESKAKKVTAAKTKADPAGKSIVSLVQVCVTAIVSAGLVLLVVGLLFKPGCRPQLSISDPSVDGVVRESALLRLNAENVECLARVVYKLGGIKIGEAAVSPYEISLNPELLREAIPGFDGGEWKLSVTGEDAAGREVATAQITLKFAGGLPRERLRELVVTFAKSVAPGQQFADEFLDAIQRGTKNYSSETVDNGQSHLAEISKIFDSFGLPSQIGVYLAMSRSGFRLPGAGEELQGFWRLSKNLLSVDAQEAETESVARYTKDISGRLSFRPDKQDYTYVVACFGMTASRTAEVNEVLRLNEGAYHDFWQMKQHLPPETIDRVVEFFAAGVVGYFPHEFGLQSKSLAPVGILVEVAER